MRRLLALAFVVLAVPASAEKQFRYEPERGAQIASLRGWRAVRSAQLASLSFPLFQVYPLGGGGGGSMTVGNPVVSGAANAVLFEDASQNLAVDATNFFWQTTANGNYLRLGAGTSPAAIWLREGSAGGTNKIILTVASALSADFTVTFPSATTTLAGLAVAQTFTNSQTISDQNSLLISSTESLGWRRSAETTPDAGIMSPGPTSNSWHFRESADWTFADSNGPCGTAACTDPTFIFYSHNQDAAEYLAVTHDGGGGVIQAANSTAKSYEAKLGKTVALTEAGAAETVITITNATTEVFGVKLEYIVTVTDATNRATRKGSLQLVCDNAATVVTCTKDATAETDDESVLIATGGATLTYAIAYDVATANVAKITFDIDSSLVVSAGSITWEAVLLGSGTIS